MGRRTTLTKTHKPLTLTLGLAVSTSTQSLQICIISGAIEQYKAWKTIRRWSAKKRFSTFTFPWGFFFLVILVSPLRTPYFWRSLIQVQRSCVQCEIQLPWFKGEAHLPGTERRRWSDDSETGTEAVLPSAPEPQSNPLEFHHRRSSSHKSGNTWGREILRFKVCIFPLALLIPCKIELSFFHCSAVMCETNALAVC